MTRAKRKSRKRLFISLALILGAGVAASVYWFHFRKRDAVITVQTEKAVRRDITELVVANGRIQPVMQVVINPEVSGEIIDLPVKEGQRVEKGDLLVKIKPDNYLAGRNSADANYKSAVAGKALALANLKKAELEFKRARELFAGQLISESQLLESETDYAVMKATLDTSIHQAEQAAAALARADDDLAKTTIFAPMAGVITNLRSQRGERVVGTALMAGTEIMTVADLEQMEARVDIGEVDVVLIRMGQLARLEVDAFRDRKFTGRVTEIANSSKASGPSGSSSSSSQPQQDATRFEVKIRLHEKEAFRPGMSVTAEVETRYRTNVLAVPIQSVTTRVPKKPPTKSESGLLQEAKAALVETNRVPEKKAKPVEVVFAIENGQAKMLPVQRGISDDSYVEITDGLDEGIEIISGGYKAINRELEEGKKIKVGPPEEKAESAGHPD